MIKEYKSLLLKDLSLRLPYNMKFQSSLGIMEMNELNIGMNYPVWANTHGSEKKPDFNYKTLKSIPCSGHGFKLEEIKPVLFPIDDLTEEIELNGEKFIPLERMAQTERGRLYLDHGEIQEKASSESSMFIARYGNERGFLGYKSTGAFIAEENDVGIWTPYYQYQMFDMMNEYMIDYRGLIQKGLAVSVHSLEVNPYKEKHA